MRQHLPKNQFENNIKNAIRIMRPIIEVDFHAVVACLSARDFDGAVSILDGLDVPNNKGLCPHPKTVIRSEILNAKRYFDPSQNS